MIPENELEFFKLKAELCKTLADPTRLIIIDRLRKREMSVGDIADTIGIAQSSVSRHLAILRERGILQPRREGNNIFYSLTDSKIGEACDMVSEVLRNKISKHSELANQLLK